MYCRFCGRPLSENTRHCRECGRLNNEAETGGEPLNESMPKLSPELSPATPEGMDLAEHQNLSNIVVAPTGRNRPWLPGTALVLSSIAFMSATLVPAVRVPGFPKNLNFFHLGKSFGYSSYAGSLLEFGAIALAMGVIELQGRRPVSWLRWARIVVLVLAFITAVRITLDLENFVRGWNSVAGAPKSFVGGALVLVWIAIAIFAVATILLTKRDFGHKKAEFYVPTRRSLFIDTGESWIRRFLDYPVWCDWILYWGLLQAFSVGVQSATDPSWYESVHRNMTHGSAEFQAYFSGFVIAVLTCAIISLVRSIFRKSRLR